MFCPQVWRGSSCTPARHAAHQELHSIQVVIVSDDMPSAAHCTALHANHTLHSAKCWCPHFVRRGNELAWALVASHNLSKAAWGALQVR